MKTLNYEQMEQVQAGDACSAIGKASAVVGVIGLFACFGGPMVAAAYMIVASPLVVIDALCAFGR